MMGIYTKKPLITFTKTGFPDEFIKLFEAKTGRECIGNKAASGTKIIEEYADYQAKTGDWISALQPILLFKSQLMKI